MAKTETAIIDYSAQAGHGMDNISNNDLQIPFLQIIQTNSPEVDKTSTNYENKGIKGASAGDIFNTVSREVLADFGKPLNVIPVNYNKAWVEWVPREEGGGMVKVHNDADILRETTKNEKYKDVLPNGNIIETTAYHYVLYSHNDNWVQALISMQATQLKHSRAWLSKITSIRMKKEDGTSFVPPMFSHSYNLYAVTESNKYGSWFGWKVEVDKVVEDTGVYDQATQAGITSRAALTDNNPF